MKPRLLKIYGLNSFQQQEIIEFDKLMQRGLFGIFGATGSGKSTILDAIILSLYGNIPRNSGDFINSDLDIANLYFEFELNKEIYIIERNFKKNKDGGYKCRLARLYQKENLEILADGANEVSRKSEELIGLKSEDFKRTVVLPQGKFSEFLTLQPKLRGEMLERILNLEDYGINLENKIKIERTEIDTKLKELNTKVNMYGDLSEELLQTEKNNHQLLLKELGKLKEQKENLKKENEIAKELWNLQQEKYFYEQKHLELVKDKQKIKLEKQKLDLAQRADIVYPYIISLETTENKLISLNDELKLQKSQCDNALKDLENKKLEYNKIKQIKDEEYDTLLKKEENLKQALNILEKIKPIQQEKENLQNQYKELKQSQDNLKLDEEKYKNNIEQNKLNLEIILKNKETLQIESELKEKIEKGYQHQNDYTNIELQVNKLTEKINYFNNLIEQNKENLLNIDNKLNIVLDELSEVDEKLSNSNQSNYNNPNILLELQNKYNNEKIKYNELKQKELKKQEVQQNLDKLNNNHTQEFESKTKELNEYLLEQEALQEQLKSFEIINKSSILAEMLEKNKPCPVCGSLEHPNPAKKIEDEIYSNLNKKIKEVQTRYSDLQINLNELATNIKITKNEKEKLNSELLILNNEINSQTSNKLLNCVNNLEQEFKDLKQKLDMFNEEKKSLELIHKQKNELKTKLELEKTRILEQYNSNTKNKEEYQSEKEFYVDKQKEIFKILTQYRNLLNISDFKQKREKILSNEKEYKKFECQEKQLREIINTNEIQKNSLIDKLRDVEKEISRVCEVGKEKKNIIGNYTLDVKTLSENNNPEEYLLKVNERINEIYTLEKNLFNELENKQLEKQDYDNKYISTIKHQETLIELKNAQHSDLQSSLLQNNFNNVNQVKEVFLEKHIQQNILQAINNYEENSKDIKNNFERLEKKLAGRSIEQERLENIKNELLKVTDELEKTNQNIAIAIEKIKTMEQNLKDLLTLKEQKTKVEHKQDLIEQLWDVIRGKNFVKFVSRQQMKYITKEASKYLKKITKDRYSIEMDENNEFIMKDNFSGGIKRKPDTLSGGELFVTSLSLSLALSSQIQLRNEAPLEFFFLDEGFGSLDTALLDTVINSLEKLHSEHMNIGIISHVEELKNRISVKLIVTPAQHGLHGSKVTLELT